MSLPRRESFNRHSTIIVHKCVCVTILHHIGTASIHVDPLFGHLGSLSCYWGCIGVSVFLSASGVVVCGIQTCQCNTAVVRRLKNDMFDQHTESGVRVFAMRGVLIADNDQQLSICLSFSVCLSLSLFPSLFWYIPIYYLCLSFSCISISLELNYKCITA